MKSIYEYCSDLNLDNRHLEVTLKLTKDCSTEQVLKIFETACELKAKTGKDPGRAMADTLEKHKLLGACSK